MNNLKGVQPNNQDLIKFIVIIVMFIDHLGFFFLSNYIILRAIGRLFPIFAFFAGYNFKVINYKILVYGLILYLMQYLFRDSLQLNILLVLFTGQLLFTYFSPKVLDIFLTISIVLSLCNYCHIAEYGTLGISFMICGLKAKKKESFIFGLFISFLSFIIFTQLNFKFIPVYLVLVILLQVGSFYLLSYTNITKPCTPRILLASRYLLEIYFWHFIIFMLIWFFTKI